MPPPDPLPTHIYKILPSPPPHDLPDYFPVSDLDANDGFIHLSTAEQVPGTVSRFFSNQTSIWLLQLELAALEGRDGGERSVKWEQSGSWCFPHVYHSDLSKALGRKDVVSLVEVHRNEGEAWEGLVREALRSAES
ncbi:hypothetical protein EJ06DRAFT_497533 [Trichodelitschia bisporula]|uniref:DUF952-domain-containing protein n=1 Tax=Trichodelitschia bisporula TaxID=703511 RepID=A0A6G1HPT3_9PEZI|nr:hypothetical protein EJ06DRAFT_497533 [Trichodelitschia bisporula]